MVSQLGNCGWGGTARATKQQRRYGEHQTILLHLCHSYALEVEGSGEPLEKDFQCELADSRVQSATQRAESPRVEIRDIFNRVAEAAAVVCISEIDAVEDVKELGSELDAVTL